MGNILKIDTSNNKLIHIQLILKDKKDELAFKPTDYKSEVVLDLIDKLLKKNKISITNINSVEAKIISGSFTGIRVGAAIANSLGFLLNISVNGKIGQVATPSYNAKSSLSG